MDDQSKIGCDPVSFVSNWTYEPMIQSLNGKVACTPFKEKSVTQKVVSHLAIPEQKHTLTSLKVLFGNKDIPAGCTVWLPADHYIKPWAKMEYTIDDQTFILVPVSEILLVK